MLSSQAWCELQLFKQVVEGQEIPETEEMRQGSQQHEGLYEEFKKKAVPTTPEEFFSEERARSREWWVRSDRLKLKGFIDDLRIDGNRIIIVDDKRNPRNPQLSWGYRRQLHGYALLLKNVYADLIGTRSIFVALRKTGSDKIEWEDEFTEEDEKEILETLQRIRDVFTRRREPQPTAKAWKCKRCPLRCEKRLAPYERENLTKLSEFDS